MKVKLRKFLHFLSFLGWYVFPNIFFCFFKKHFLIWLLRASEHLFKPESTEEKYFSQVQLNSTDMLWGRKGRHELCPLQPLLHPSPSEPPDAALRQKELYSRLSARQIVQKQTATMHPKFTGLLLDFTSMSWPQRQQRKKSPAEDEEPVAPVGTCPHKGLSVLASKWELTTVAMFVTSSYGQQACMKQLPATGATEASYWNICICFSRMGDPISVALMHSGKNQAEECWQLGRFLTLIKTEDILFFPSKGSSLNNEISPIFSTLLCLRRLWWHFRDH